MERNTILQQISDATGVLIQLYSNNNIQCFGLNAFEPNPVNEFIPDAIASDHTLVYSYSPEYVFGGFVRIKGTTDYIIIGPILFSQCYIDRSRRILADMGHPVTDARALTHWLQSMPIYDMSRLQGTIRHIGALINGISSDEVHQIAWPVTHSHNYSDFPSPQFIDRLDDSFENKILLNIEFGNVNEVNKLVNAFKASYPEQLEFDGHLHSYQNSFIESASLASRAAVRGGLEYSTALTLCKNHINYMEKLPTYKDIVVYLQQMLLDFTKRVAIFQSLSSNSLLVRQANDEIQLHIYEKITPSIIASNLNINCSYLCAHFKRETGKTITEHINELKINEGKRLLKTKQIPLIHISTQLGYSSQSYFQRVFKKFTKITPNQYRNQPQ